MTIKEILTQLFKRKPLTVTKCDDGHEFDAATQSGLCPHEQINTVDNHLMIDFFSSLPTPKCLMCDGKLQSLELARRGTMPVSCVACGAMFQASCEVDEGTIYLEKLFD